MNARTRLDVRALESEARKSPTMKFWPAARALGATSHHHAYWLAKSGAIPVIRRGRVLRLHSHDVLAALDAEATA